MRHTNLPVIADRRLPYWPHLETVDISLVDDIPTVLDVVDALQMNSSIGHAGMAEEFLANEDQRTHSGFATS